MLCSAWPLIRIICGLRFGIAGSALGHKCVRRRVPALDSSDATTTGVGSATAAAEATELAEDRSEEPFGGSTVSEAVAPAAAGTSDGEADSERSIRRMVRKARKSAAAASPADAASPGAAAARLGQQMHQLAAARAAGHAAGGGSGVVWLPAAAPGVATPGKAAAASSPLSGLSAREQRVRATRLEKTRADAATAGAAPDPAAAGPNPAAGALRAVPAREAIPIQLRAHGQRQEIQVPCAAVVALAFGRLAALSFSTLVSAVCDPASFF